ncbi:DUF456 domain-containing protein [Chryseolinea sp. H1M3-3]|uniref:DUF456 domain-containing protein n=1 Tax=Chryseolinea sp. H1M3-3 TaxID=3034144 RepID=UPI0023EC90F4|nr:DUF456 domain-containing protein [Chryseolinea sp. H1M3-3]
MDTFWLVLGIIIMIVGVMGCILPLLPGPPLCYVALLLQQLRSDPPFTAKFLWIWAGITVAVTVLDYVIPLYGTRRYGGSKYGIWGCTLGLIAGFWLGPLGIIIGPFVGAFIGEMLANNNSERALKAAWGSFVGFLFGTLLKLIACVVMVWYLIKITF